MAGVPPPGSLRAHLDRLSDLLRCPICGDFFNTPVVFQRCMHTYCSICIRRALQFKLECPTCREDSNAPAAAVTPLAQPPRQYLHKDAPSQLTQFTQYPIAPLAAPEVKPVTTLKRMLEKPVPPAEQDKKVKCPVCSLYVVEAMVNAHLDTCLGTPSTRVTFQEAQMKRFPKPAARLPLLGSSKIVYNICSDQFLRKLLRTAGLPAKGKREELIKRHKEYVLQYTAEQDAALPRAPTQIARDVEVMASTLAAEAPQLEEITEKHPGYVTLISDVMQRKKLRSASQASQLQSQPSQLSVASVAVKREQSVGGDASQAPTEERIVKRRSARADSDIERVTPPVEVDMAAEMSQIQHEDERAEEADARDRNRIGNLRDETTKTELSAAMLYDAHQRHPPATGRLKGIASSQSQSQHFAEDSRSPDSPDDTNSSLAIWSRTQNLFQTGANGAPPLQATSDPPSSPHLSPVASELDPLVGQQSQTDVVQSSPFVLPPAKPEHRQLAAKGSVMQTKR